MQERVDKLESQVRELRRELKRTRATLYRILSADQFLCHYTEDLNDVEESD